MKLSNHTPRPPDKSVESLLPARRSAHGNSWTICSPPSFRPR